MRDRRYVIVCNEHSGMFRGTLLFWGSRTEEGQERSFGGYTSDIDNCEIYSENEVKEKGYYFPMYHDGMTWEEFRGYDDILIEPQYLEKLGYKQMRVWYKP
jgi:hypothetical protein